MVHSIDGLIDIVCSLMSHAVAEAPLGAQDAPPANETFTQANLLKTYRLSIPVLHIFNPNLKPKAIRDTVGRQLEDHIWQATGRQVESNWELLGAQPERQLGVVGG